MEKKAIIDVGSNSIKFHLAEVDREGNLLPLLDKNNIARLGEGLKEKGKISPEVMERNSLAIAQFVKEAIDEGAVEIFGVGTMALRTAENKDEFLALVKKDSGLEIQVISGEEEARLSYLGVLSGMNLKDEEVVVFDTGGGSTEFIYGKGAHIRKKFSQNLGAVTITEEFFFSDPVTPKEVENALQFIKASLLEGGVLPFFGQLVGLGGTLTSIGAVKHEMKEYDPLLIQGSTLTKEDLEGQLELYRSKTVEERRKITGLQPKRAEVILAGVAIVLAIMETLNAPSLVISDGGLRHGFLYDVVQKRKSHNR